MNFNSVLPRAQQPRFHEGSAMRSVRDSDANSKMWQKNRDIGKAVNSVMQATDQNTKQIQKLKRRIVGGGAVGGSGGFDIYDPTKAYTAGQTFFVPLPATIDGIAVAAGLYGVPAAGTNSVGTFAGGVPANPTGNAVPQAPLPAITTAPNDVYYSILISGTCSTL